jgi:hypothetical protein
VVLVFKNIGKKCKLRNKRFGFLLEIWLRQQCKAVNFPARVRDFVVV